MGTALGFSGMLTTDWSDEVARRSSDSGRSGGVCVAAEATGKNAEAARKKR